MDGEAPVWPVERRNGLGRTELPPEPIRAVESTKHDPDYPDVDPVTGDEAETEPDVLDMSRTKGVETVTDDRVSSPVTCALPRG